MGYTYLKTVHDQGQAAFIESVLKAGGVRYNIGTDIAGRVVGGLGLNQTEFYVHPHDYDKAVSILERAEEDAGKPKSRFTRKKASKRRKKKPRVRERDSDEGAAEGRRLGDARSVFLILVSAFVIVMIMGILIELITNL